MQKQADAEVVYRLLVRYRDCPGGNEKRIWTTGNVFDIRAQLLQKVEKYILFFNSPSTSAVEKSTLCKKGKALYQKYCLQIKDNPKLHSTRLEQKMDELLHLIAEFESEKFQLTRKRQVAGDRIDLEKLFAENRSINVLMGRPLDEAVCEMFKRKSCTVIGEDNTAVYMTASGTKYHRKDCPFCKGRTLISIGHQNVESLNLKPCKCLEMAVSEQETVAEKKEEKAAKFVTAFVDESIRSNPWRGMDESLPEKQSLYSYIVCDGFLAEEKLITKKNTLFTGVNVSEEVDSTDKLAVEAIMAVLFKLVAQGYEDNVLIYTDNIGAKELWCQSVAGQNLAKLFKSVMVSYVPREGNETADSLGRKRAIMELPVEVMIRILGRNKGYFKLKEEMDFVKKYFPEPMKNIPNLMSELTALAEIGESKWNM